MSESSNTIFPKNLEIIKELEEDEDWAKYIAYDSNAQNHVMLKVSKMSDEQDYILKNEYEWWQKVQEVLECSNKPSKIQHCYGKYKLLSGEEALSFEFKGMDLAEYKASMPQEEFDLFDGWRLAIKMLEAIQQLHEWGYIHRDIRPENFVLEKHDNCKRVYLTNLGLAKRMNSDPKMRAQNQSVFFQRKMYYASLSVHYELKLGKKDDLISWYFCLLEFLSEKLEWKDVPEDEVKEIKVVKERWLK